MRLNVLLFASLKDAVGAPQVELELPADTPVSGLLNQLGESYPSVARWTPHVRVAVNQEYVQPDHVLSEGDEVAIIPPVSGGAGPALVAVVDRVLSLDEVVQAVETASAGTAGAVCSFWGVVRRNSVDTSGNKHDDIEFLDYEAYAPMAEAQMRIICEEAGERWGAHCALTHRVGRLYVGEASVAIAVATAHRAESFEACRYIIEELKKRVPIWKKETASDGFWWSEGISDGSKVQE